MIHISLSVKLDFLFCREGRRWCGILGATGKDLDKKNQLVNDRPIISLFNHKGSSSWEGNDNLINQAKLFLFEMAEVFNFLFPFF